MPVDPNTNLNIPDALAAPGNGFTVAPAAGMPAAMPGALQQAAGQNAPVMPMGQIATPAPPTGEIDPETIPKTLMEHTSSHSHSGLDEESRQAAAAAGGEMEAAAAREKGAEGKIAAEKAAEAADAQPILDEQAERLERERIDKQTRDLAYQDRIAAKQAEIEQRFSDVANDKEKSFFAGAEGTQNRIRANIAIALGGLGMAFGKAGGDLNATNKGYEAVQDAINKWDTQEKGRIARKFELAKVKKDELPQMIEQHRVADAEHEAMLAKYSAEVSARIRATAGLHAGTIAAAEGEKAAAKIDETAAERKRAFITESATKWAATGGEHEVTNPAAAKGMPRLQDPYTQLLKETGALEHQYKGVTELERQIGNFERAVKTGDSVSIKVAYQELSKVAHGGGNEGAVAGLESAAPGMLAKGENLVSSLKQGTPGTETLKQLVGAGKDLRAGIEAQKSRLGESLDTMATNPKYSALGDVSATHFKGLRQAYGLTPKVAGPDTAAIKAHLDELKTPDGRAWAVKNPAAATKIREAAKAAGLQ